MLSNKPSSNSYAEFALILYIYYKSAQVCTKKRVSQWPKCGAGLLKKINVKSWDIVQNPSTYF